MELKCNGNARSDATAGNAAAETDGETVALQRAFRKLCGDYEELLDEATSGTQPVDERIGLALFKIDEACAVTDSVRMDAEQSQEQLMDALIENCHELEDIFIRINIMERFVSKVQDSARELEKRMESINRAAGPVFNAGSVTSLLRSFSKRVVSESAPVDVQKWEPMAFDFNTKELMTRLENGDARELGVSISSASASASASSSSSSALLSASVASSLSSTFAQMQEHPIYGLHANSMNIYHFNWIEKAEMEVTWRDLALVDPLSGALTPAGATLLEKEILEERLAVITLLGAPSNQRQRVELLAHLLQQQQHATSVASSSPLTLLACVSYMEEDYRILVLDVNTTQGSPGLELVGAFCALSSLVVNCFSDDGDSTGGWFGGESSTNATLVPELPKPFMTLFQTLLREHATAEVHELVPNLLTVDFSSSRSLKERPVRGITQRGRGSDCDEDDGALALEGIIQFKRMGIAYPEAIADTQLLEFFAPHAPVKKLFSVELTGEILLMLLQHFTRDVQSGEEPDVGSAWDELVESKCSAVADDAFATYVDCIHSSARESPPMELDAFNKLHDEIQRLAMDMYHSSAKLFKSSRKRSVRNKLKASIRAKYEQELQVLHENSHTHCQEVRVATWTQLSRELNDEPSSSGDDGGGSSTSFAAVLDTILRFDEQYNQHASGPEKATVLRDFYRNEAIQVFQKLEAIVTRQMTEIHLKELRKQLEREFEGKKEALIAHFKQEETQLRACMAREIETMQKMHQARSSRVKIDENETKRVRDELRQVYTRNAELESHKAVLEQAQEGFLAQRSALERKVDELELSVHHEMASRAELVDTLAVTIKSAEERENTLKAEVEELRHELGEKTFRVENELKELTFQLRKTNEEKEELQKQLNDFFIKITALPAALQQHLFCSDSSDEVQFADALTGFMSR